MGEVDGAGRPDGFRAEGMFGSQYFAFGHQCADCGGPCTQPQAHAEAFAAAKRTAFGAEFGNPVDPYVDYGKTFYAASVAEARDQAQAYAIERGWELRRMLFVGRVISDVAAVGAA